jgi:hypothetical protein
MTDTLPRETALEESGQINTLQHERWNLWRDEQSQNKKRFNIHELLQTEVKLRENAQREVALKDKLAIYQKPPTTGGSLVPADLIQGLRAEVTKLNEEYWMLERKWWSIEGSLIEGPLARGMKLWRSHPKWYMHCVLREDCAETGRCCGRDCGCCSNRHLPKRKFAAGHCTVECHCCEKARGFELSSEKKAQVEKLFDLGVDRGYFKRIRHASLLGLIHLNLDNPFDLIEDPPPRYEAPAV